MQIEQFDTGLKTKTNVQDIILSPEKNLQNKNLIRGYLNKIITSGVSEIDKNLNEAFIKTLRITSMIVTILLGGMMFASIFVALGGLSVVRNFFEVSNLTVWPTILIFMLITFIAGFVLEFISIMIIVVPVAVAVLRPMGVDDVWFCILFLIVIQTSYLTPPMAPAIFFLRGISPPEIRLVDMYRGVIPFIMLHFVCIGLIIIFPELALLLPEIMFDRIPSGTPN